MSFQLRNKLSYWINRYQKRYSVGMEQLIFMEQRYWHDHRRWSDEVDSMRPYQDALSCPPLECYNLISKLSRNLSNERINEYRYSPDKVTGLLWGHLVMGEQEFGPSIGTTSTDGHNTFRILEEELWAMYNSEYAARQKTRPNVFEFPKIDTTLKNLFITTDIVSNNAININIHFYTAGNGGSTG